MKYWLELNVWFPIELREFIKEELNKIYLETHATHPFSIENEAQKEAETKRVGCIV